jgi:hypothetical protein
MKLWQQIRPQGKLEWFFAVCATVLPSIFVVVMSLFVYLWFIDDNPPLDVANEPTPITSEQEIYQPGDTIYFRVDACRRTRGEIRFTRYWVDTLQYIEPEQVLPGAEIECFDRSLPATVPPLLPGKYHVEYHVAYKVNFLRWQLVTFKTETFTVGE